MRKKIFNSMIIVSFLGLSGCATKEPTLSQKIENGYNDTKKYSSQKYKKTESWIKNKIKSW